MLRLLRLLRPRPRPDPTPLSALPIETYSDPPSWTNASGGFRTDDAPALLHLAGIDDQPSSAAKPARTTVVLADWRTHRARVVEYPDRT